MKNYIYQYNKTIRKMIDYYDVTKENIENHNPSWPHVPDHP